MVAVPPVYHPPPSFQIDLYGYCWSYVTHGSMDPTPVALGVSRHDISKPGKVL